MRRLIVLLLLCLSGLAWGQDYEREQRWAAEVVPALVVGDAVNLKLASGREFLGLYTEADAKPAKGAVLLVHGVGVHPDHGVIGILRVALVDAGYTTLSIQMPVLRSDAGADEYFPRLFPEAAARIRAGADWLKSKGFAHPALLSHSLGSRMSNGYYEEAPDAPFGAWICLGMSGGFGRMGNVKVPVLDVYGENDLPGVRRADWRRRMTLGAIEGSKQIMIPGADHHYAGKERDLTAAIIAFLAR